MAAAALVVAAVGPAPGGESVSQAMASPAVATGDVDKPSAMAQTMALWPKLGEWTLVERGSGKWKRYEFHSNTGKPALSLFSGIIRFSRDPNEAAPGQRPLIYSFMLTRSSEKPTLFDAAVAGSEQIEDMLRDLTPLYDDLSHRTPVYKRDGEARGIMMVIDGEPNSIIRGVRSKPIDRNVKLTIDGKRVPAITRGRLSQMVVGKVFTAKGVLKPVALVSDARVVIQYHVCVLDLTTTKLPVRESEVAVDAAESMAMLASLDL